VYLDKEECDKASQNLPDSINQKYLIAYSLGKGGFGEVSLIFEKVKHEAEMQNCVNLTSSNFKLLF
jgi:hypothetical protein